MGFVNLGFGAKQILPQSLLICLYRTNLRKKVPVPLSKKKLCAVPKTEAAL
jgi:hypothetical protein